MNVQLLNENFNFNNLKLMPPTGVQGGAYFSKLKSDNEKLIIQTPKCGTKNGIKKTGKKSYCDLMFSNDEVEFLVWSEKFEDKIKDLIFNNKESWFHDDLEKDDIEYNWNSTLRSYKSKYHLFRTYIEKSKVLNNGPKLQIFNEDQEKLTLADINENSNMICILEIKGLKFTSQSFHLECSLIQIMILEESEDSDGCLIKFSNNKKTNKRVKKNDISQKENNLEEKVLNTEQEDDEAEKQPEQINLLLENGSVDTLEKVEGKEGVNLENNESENIENMESENIENMESENMESENMESENMENMESENMENVEVKNNNLEKVDTILEVNLELPKDLEINSMKLKKPKEVYIEMYEQALKKSKLAKRLSIEAYLESKEIKRTYMLDIDEYLDDDLEKMIINDN
jgi:hypothetical protein